MDLTNLSINKKRALTLKLLAKARLELYSKPLAEANGN